MAEKHAQKREKTAFAELSSTRFPSAESTLKQIKAMATTTDVVAILQQK